MKITIKSRSGRQLATLDLAPSDTILQLKQQFKKTSGYDVNRQWFTLPNSKDKLADEKTLAALNLSDGAELYFKDLGFQINYALVFYLEYLGPLVLHCLPFWFPQLFYSLPRGKPKPVQEIAFWLAFIHFAKRELETLFVHKFSNPTMPLFPFLRNTSYYWLLNLLMAYYIHHPLYTNTHSWVTIGICTAIIVACMFGNFKAHLMLSNLRPAGTRTYGLPTGFLFNYVSCPNYTFEITQWLVYAYMTSCLWSYVFWLAGTGTMVVWAIKKHKRYRQYFNGQDGRPKYPSKRKIVFPFIF